MAFHAENNWFRSAEKLISTDFWVADGSEDDAPLGTSAGGVRIKLGSIPGAMRMDCKLLKRVARPEGFEPPTRCLEGFGFENPNALFCSHYGQTFLKSRP